MQHHDPYSSPPMSIPHIKRLLPHADTVIVSARSEDRACKVPLNPPHVPTMIAKTARERVPRGADLEDADAAVLYVKDGNENARSRKRRWSRSPCRCCCSRRRSSRRCFRPGGCCVAPRRGSRIAPKSGRRCPFPPPGSWGDCAPCTRKDSSPVCSPGRKNRTASSKSETYPPAYIYTRTRPCSRSPTRQFHRLSQPSTVQSS